MTQPHRGGPNGLSSSSCGSVSYLFFFLSLPVFSLSINEPGKEFNPEELNLTSRFLPPGSQLQMGPSMVQQVMDLGNTLSLRLCGFYKSQKVSKGAGV